MQIQEFHVKPENGLSKTLELMNELEQRATRSQFFQESVKSLFEHLKFSKIMLYEKVWEFVRKNFKYTQDRFDEEIKNPLLMFHFKTGDCDDFSLFIKSTLRVLGIRSHYILLGKNENEFTHIAVLTNDGIVIDGANELFGVIHPKYKYKKVV